MKMSKKEVLIDRAGKKKCILDVLIEFIYCLWPTSLALSLASSTAIMLFGCLIFNLIIS